jgi:N-acetyltransferase 10
MKSVATIAQLLRTLSFFQQETKKSFFIFHFLHQEMGPPLVKKKVDSRIRALIENGVKTRHRSFFVIVGDHGKDQVMYLHYMLSKARVAAKPNVLWCYKKELGFSSHKKKRMKQHQAMIKKGLKDADSDDPFELFLAGTDIRYCYYKESEKILGNTFGMCVLQDFEALTPNLLARTIETVEGGGVVVLLLRSMNSLKQLYTMSMDVHARYRTQSHNDVVNRFNERFILSLSASETCLVVDDELNILPVSAGRSVVPLPALDDEQLSESQVELKELKDSLKETEPIGSLVNQARTLDQAKALLTFIEAISEKTLRSTVTLTAARGRGKSAALGVAMAAAVSFGYSNIFVTSPTPENLKTLFDFVFKAFDALGYQEHMDYDIIQSTNPDFNKAIVRVNIYRDHRQTIQYIQPQDFQTLGQAELLVIDEAAAIPLPVIKKLLGPYLVFMASTINGYEGTGRSLSIKLIQQLREQSRGFNSGKGDSSAATGGRSLREIKLEEPIRYAPGDQTEKWLNKLLCLDATSVPRMASGCPHPNECELYYVNRDTLFSYHPLSEEFLQRMMSLCVASHYKNSPNDLQLMSDAPAHNLFVLLPPVSEETTTLPEPLCVIQLCLEGEISRDAVMASLSRGKRADGDLIPWSVSQQFQDDDFASLSGARIVRIASHPDYTRMGYGTRALQLLIDYYEGKMANVDESDDEADESMKRVTEEELAAASLKTEQLRIRDASVMPPLLLSLSEKKPPSLHWLGVSYGLTPDLLRYWKRAQFAPVYLRQTANELTGEHTCIMLRTLEKSAIAYNPRWLSEFSVDFKKRFMTLLGYQFRDFSVSLCLSLLEAVDNVAGNVAPISALSADEVRSCLSPYDLKRMESYANNMLDYHVIMDLVPTLAAHFFNNQLSAPKTVEDGESAESTKVVLSAAQRAILLGVGSQHRSIESVASELKLPVSQILALFVRLVRKAIDFYRQIRMTEVESKIDLANFENGTSTLISEVDERKNLDVDEDWDPTQKTLEEDLDEAAKEKMQQMRDMQRQMIDSLDLTQYTVGGEDADWNVAGKAVHSKGSAVVSVRNSDSSKLKRKGISIEEVAKEAQRSDGRPNKKNKKKTKR